VEYLQEEGWCMDNIEVKQATDSKMGRGAFATRALKGGDVVAPAPLQCFKDRRIFQQTAPEQLFVNYCLQPENSKMIFYSYGAGVNLINHDFANPNVEFRWAQNKSIHHADWLLMTYNNFWKTTTPGGLVLEVVALRDIEPEEELFLNYGQAWEKAWNEHVKTWQPVRHAADYVYPQEIDETLPLRTVYEQVSAPYPPNLVTMCSTPDWGIRREGIGDLSITWWDPGELWWEYMQYCHIVSKKVGPKGDFVYQVEIDLNPSAPPFNPNKPMEERIIDNFVPRRAIRFIERPYMDDEHLPNVFRHPIQFPDHLVPDVWKNKRY